MELLQSKTWRNLLILCFIFDQIFAYPKNEICLTKGCIKAASEIIDAMDTKVDPCDNFYNFACGNYIKKSNLINEEDENSITNDMSEEIKKQIRTIVSEAININEPKPYKLVKTFYSQCMYKAGTESFLEMLESFGGWPILKGENWNKTEFKYSEFISEMQKYQENNYLFSLRIKSESIELTGILPSDNGYSETEVYRNYMNNFLTLLGCENNGKTAELDEIFKFETKLQEMLDDLPIDDDDEDVTITLKQFQEQNNYLNWTNHINKMRPIPNYVDENDEIHIYHQTYFKRLGELIASTPERTLANYLMWNFAKTSAKYLSIGGFSSRWMFCIKEVKANLVCPLSSMYIKKQFGKQIKPNIKEMIRAIRIEAVSTFQEARWMKKTTQAELLQKLDDLEFKYIGFFNELMDSVKMERYYENLNLGSDFFETSLKLKQHMLYNDINPLELYYRFMPPFHVNAFYDLDENSINIPAAILQYPMYNSNQPQYINYGKTGWTIGHEISHMFDDGRELLGEDRVNCLIDQYSSFFEKSINQTLNGAQTIAEDLADNIGLKLTYRTYLNYINYVGDELKLPGLNYTPEQLFWIASAQGYCSSQGVGRKETLYTDDAHTLEKWRVLGSFRNMVEFSEDFQCSKNSKMNPSKRCEIWK